MRGINFPKEYLMLELGNRLINHKVTKWVFAAIGGLVVALPPWWWARQIALLHGISVWLIYLSFSVVLTILIYFGLCHFALPHMKEYSVKIKVLWAGGSLLVGCWLGYNILIPVPVLNIWFLHLPAAILKLLFYSGTGLGIGILLLIISAWLVTLPLPEPKTSDSRWQPWNWLIYALPMLVSWGVTLLAFWPGMMSKDSMDQWGQMLSGQYNDHHPAFDTFLIWLLTRISLSPVIVAVAQILGLALVAGAGLMCLEYLGVPRKFLWLASLLFAISPVNSTMVITLWKDIPYGIAVLGLTFLLLAIVNSKGKWIDNTGHKIILGIAAALVGLTRHEGLAIGLGMLIILFPAYPRRWKSWLITLAIAAVLFLGIRGPVYQLVHVGKDEPGVEFNQTQLSLYTLAAYSAPNSQADTIFNSIQLFSNQWGCKSWSNFYPSNELSNQNRSIGPLKIVENLVQRLPKLFLFYFRCGRSTSWIIWDPQGHIYNTSNVDDPVKLNPYGIVPDSKLPGLRTIITDWVLKTAWDTNLSWFTWRPAIFLYIFLFIVAIQAIKHKTFRLLIPGLPALIQVLTLSVISINPEFRYYYSIYLVSLLYWPILFARGRKGVDTVFGVK
jgi:hypothetical protein